MSGANRSTANGRGHAGGAGEDGIAVAARRLILTAVLPVSLFQPYAVSEAKKKNRPAETKTPAGPSYKAREQ